LSDPIDIVCGWAVPSGDTHHAKWIQERGSIDHDWQLLEWLWPHIKRGSTVVDIGAHIGTHSVPYMRAVGNEGMVIAIEPNPVNFCCLLFNMMKEASQWKIPPIWHAEMMAAEEFKGWLWLDPDNQNHGATRVIPMKGLSPDLRSLPITKCESVRHLLLDLGQDDQVSFVKVDVEGFEPNVVRNLYLLPKPFTLFVEVNGYSLDRAGSSKDELYSIIASNVDSKTHSFSVYQTGEVFDEVPMQEPDSLRELEMYDILVSPKP
jgi:FkbM family methyltransferase